MTSQLLRLLDLDQPIPTSPSGGRGHPTRTRGCRCVTNRGVSKTALIDGSCLWCGRLVDTRPRHDREGSVI